MKEAIKINSKKKIKLIERVRFNQGSYGYNLGIKTLLDAKRR
jgi:hypothetical protein